MTTLWIGRQMTNTDILQDVCELIYFVDPDAMMQVGSYRRKYGSCRLWLTFRIDTIEEAVAYVHGDLVQAGCVYVEDNDDLIPVRTWAPSGAGIELESHNLHRTQGKGPGLFPTHSALAISGQGLAEISEPPSPESARLRYPNTRKTRSQSLRDLANDTRVHNE